MNVYAIGDLHLSKSCDKPMDVFGPQWEHHAEKIFDAWSSCVKMNDIVCVLGDTSWAMNLNEAEADFLDISRLPGIKVFIRGNHDYWWSSLNKVTTEFSKYSSMHFLQNNSVSINGFSFSGSRGWLCPQSASFCKSDENIYKRELIRMELSLRAAETETTKIAMIHYPPMSEMYDSSGFTDLFERYGIFQVVYGHLHSTSCKAGYEGIKNGILYSLCSSDYLGFKPKLIAQSD